MPEQCRKRRILHIAETLSGGVATAISSYGKNSPHCKHYIYASVRKGLSLNTPFVNFEKVILSLPRFPVFAIIAIQLMYWKIKPDYVHLHSSFGGLYGRLNFIPQSKIIYTPHCYAFERTDISDFKRWLYTFVEKALAFRLKVVAACSFREKKLAETVVGVRALFLPNVGEGQWLFRKYPVNRKTRIVMCGRVCPQKGCDFFFEFYQQLQKAGISSQYEVIWIGDGDPVWVLKMKQVGIEVTGWLEQKEALCRMNEADVYFHTAAWEGLPISVLEACSMGIPVVARNIEALKDIGVETLFDTPSEALSWVLMMTNEKWAEVLDSTKLIADRYSCKEQKSALELIYGHSA